MISPLEFKPGRYEHYKGGQYVALHLVMHHESGELFVVYVSCTYASLHLREWASEGKDSWTDEVNVPNHDPHYGTEFVPRFRYIGHAL